MPRRSAQSIRRRKILAWVLRIAFYILGTAVLLWAVAFLLRLDFMAVQNISVEGNEFVDGEAVGRIVDEELDGSYWLIVPRDNAFFYPAQKIEERIRNEFPRVFAVDARVDSNTLTVAIIERQPHSLWCSGEDKCFFIDETGIVYAPAPMFSDNVFFVFRGVLDPENALGQQYLPQTLFEELNEFLGWLALLDFFPGHMNALAEDSFVISTANGAEIIIGTEDSFKDTFQNLETVMQDEDLMNSKRQEYSDLEYVDLRFGNKVFYKLKE